MARTLLFNENYRESHALLDTLAILPFEGARYGHDAYRQACVLLATQKLLQKDEASAVAMVHQARSWPERLGAGKPYDVDTRLEDYLEACVLKEMGTQKGLDRLLSSVNEYTFSHTTSRSAQQLIGALALRDTRRTEEARALLTTWLHREPESDMARWALAVFEKQPGLVLEIEQRLRPTVLNRATGDQEFLLVHDVVHMLQW